MFILFSEETTLIDKVFFLKYLVCEIAFDQHL